MKQHVLFFDLDGTVADSGAGIMGAMNEVLVARGAAPLTRDDLRHIVGPPLATSYPTFFVPRGLPHDGADEFIADYRAIYTPKYVPQTPTFDGILDVLDTLGRNWHLAIVTSKPEKQALMVLDVTQARSRFVHLVAAESDNEVPKARLLEQAIRDLRDVHSISVEHDQCWMIGDRHHDIDAATEVGTKGLGVLWGFGSREELTSAGAHAIAEQPADLLTLLAR
ncbi:MAG: HAD family hydrolase [Actinomycetota bacterium]